MEEEKYAEIIGFGTGGRKISNVEAFLDITLLDGKNDDYSFFKDKYVTISTSVSQTCGVYQGTTKERNVILSPAMIDRHVGKKDSIVHKRELSDSPQVISRDSIIQISQIGEKDLEALLSCSSIEPKVKDNRTDSK